MADELEKQLIGGKTEAPVNQEATPEQTPAPEQQDQVPPEDSETERHRKAHAVLQGKYNAEVPRVAAENRSLKERIAALEQQITDLQSKNTAPPVSEEDVERFGPELADFVKRVAGTNQSFDPAKLSKLEQEVTQVKEHAVETAKEKFFAKLDQQSPNWSALNTDARFLEWLAEYDPLLGRARQESFDEAYASLDVNRVSAFFNAFGGASSRVSRPSINEQVVPASSSSAPPQNDSAKRIWTAPAIRKFYEDMRKGRISEADAAQIEADLAAAQQEGRIRA